MTGRAKVPARALLSSAAPFRGFSGTWFALFQGLSLLAISGRPLRGLKADVDSRSNRDVGACTQGAAARKGAVECFAARGYNGAADVTLGRSPTLAAGPRNVMLHAHKPEAWEDD